MLFTLLLCGCFSMSYGADIYLSSGGSDSNDGLTALTPVASFSKAQSLVGAGETIFVSGMIDMWSDSGNTTFTSILPAGSFSTTNKTGITITKSITIQGTNSANDGFTGTNGANSTRFFQITSNVTVSLKNLKLANGKIISNLTASPPTGGAINMTNGNIIAENVIFDSNEASGSTGITGAAIYINGTNTSGTSFKNCIFSNNKADKAGAVNINTWAAGTASVPNVILFENCSFVGNEAKNTGGSAIMARSASEYTTLNVINCTFSKNKVTTISNGGTINMGAKGMRYLNMNFINCTITENTTAGSTGNGAGLNYVNTTANNIGNLYIKNTIIENNTTIAGAFSDLNVSAASPTVPETGSSASVPGYIKIENSLIGAHISDNTRVPAGNVISSQLGYLTGSSTAADLRAKFGTFNTTTNSYPLLATSAAIEYGAQSFLSAVGVTTDQVGTIRAFAGGFCTAGAIEHSLPANEKIWKGITSTDATVASNWAYGATPTGTDFITITKKTFDPVFGNITINGGLIETGAKLFVDEGKILTNNGTITNNGSLVLKANATGNASLVSATSVANVQLQRYLSSNQRGWRMLSNPLSSTTFAAVATSSNLTLGANFTGEYLPASNTWTSTDDTVAMDNQKAYKVFITGQAGEAPDYLTGPTNVTVKIVGTAANTAPAAIATTATQFYLVANPYTAPVSVGSIITASSGLTNSVSYYDPTKSATDVKVKAGGYDALTISGAAGSATDIVLPPMGSIFVQASADGTINIPASVIFTGTPAQSGSFNQKSTQSKVASTNALKVIVSSEGVNYDTVALQFKNVGEASSNINFGKLPNTFVDAYTIADSQKRAISELELKDQIIPFGITSNLQKSFNLKVTENTIPAGFEAVLVDNLLNTTTAMTPGASYDFAIDSNPASQGDARFAINLKTAGTLSVVANELDSKINIWPNPARAEVNITNLQNANDGTSRIEISNLNGQLIHSQKSNPGTTTAIQTKGWATGVYILKANNNGTETTKKLIIQ